MKPRDTNEVCILLGGGIDSTALIAFYLTRQTTVKGIHFNYGQPSLAGERKAVAAVARHYKIPLYKIDLGLKVINNSGEYRCRNGLLLLTAAASLASSNTTLAIGIHRGSPYYDCTPGFVNDIQRLMDGYSGGTLAVEAPFIDFAKANIFAFCRKNNVPVHVTYSCERRSRTPCGKCLSCQDREVFDASQ